MAGLKICTRWRANSARRRRRISSSLLPENIGPTTTSIQPMLPLTMSTLAPSEFGTVSATLGARYVVPLVCELANTVARFCVPGSLRTRSDSGAIHLLIIERSEGRDDGNAKRFLARDQVGAEDAPRALRVANAYRSGETVDGHGKLDSIFDNLVRQRIRKFHSAGSSIVAAHSVGHVGPAFQKNAAAPVRIQGGVPHGFVLRSAFVDNIQSAFQPHKIAPALVLLARQFYQRFGAQPRAEHQFFAGRRRVAHSARDLRANQFKHSARREQRRNRSQRFGNGMQFWLASAADGDDDFFHERAKSQGRL